MFYLNQIMHVDEKGTITLEQLSSIKLAGQIRLGPRAKSRRPNCNLTLAPTKCFTSNV